MHFLQFLRFYKNLNELPLGNRPGEDVLEDDAALDKWYDGYIRQVASDSGSPMARKGRAEPTQMYEG